MSKLLKKKDKKLIVELQHLLSEEFDQPDDQPEMVRYIMNLGRILNRTWSFQQVLDNINSK